MRIVALVVAVAVAAAQKAADPDVKLLQKTSGFMDAFPDVSKMSQYYDEDATVEMHSTFLPFAGTYEGADEIETFYDKMGNSVAFNKKQYEIKYLDGRTGNVGVLMRFMDGRFRGRVLDERERFFTKDQYVDTFHYFTFNTEGDIVKHEIKVNNLEEVFEHAAPNSLKRLRELQTAFYEEDDSLWDMIHDDIEVNIHNEALFGNSTFTGKEGVTELMNMLKPEESDEKDAKGMDDSEFNITTLFADSDTVHQKICYKKFKMPNGKVLKDFDVYKTMEFDPKGLLQLVDVSFSRMFEPSEVNTYPSGGAESESKKDEETKPTAETKSAPKPTEAPKPDAAAPKPDAEAPAAKPEDAAAKAAADVKAAAEKAAAAAKPPAADAKKA